MNILSSWYHDDDENIESLTMETITFEMESANRITIISAYYSVIFLKKIFKSVQKVNRQLCKLELIFNGFSGERLHDQIKELNALKKSLKKIGFENISILLNRETTLFHTKLYFISNEGGALWFAGSANASMAAFERNEELLIRNKTNIKTINQYISSVIENSIAIEEIDLDDITESNIIGFFRTGSIYFKPNNQISFTFSALDLPDEVEMELTKILERPKYTNAGKAWGAYNLKLSLGLIERDKKESCTRLSLKPWSIETCFGYWVPNKYRPLVNNKINEKSKNKKAELQEILKRLKQRGISKLISDYKSYLLDAKRILDENEIEWQINEDELIEKFAKFVNKIESKLSDEDKLNKLCLPLISTGMPEIWEDILAYDDFSESFYEYISGCWSEKLPLIIKTMMHYIEFEKGDDSETVTEHFFEYFDSDEAEWTDEYWFDR